MQKMNKNGGFTLVELIVSLGIAVAVIALTCTVLVSSFNFFSKDNDLTQAKVIGDIVIDHISENLRFATSMEIADTEDNLSDNKKKYAMTITDGRLWEWETAKKNETYRDVYGENFYRGMTVTVTSKINPSDSKEIIIDRTRPENPSAQNQWLTIKIEVKNKQCDVLYNTEKTFELLNFTANIETYISDAHSTLTEKNLLITGDMKNEHQNAVICYDAQKVNNRQNYIPPPAEMYERVNTYLDSTDDEKREEFRAYGIDERWINNNDYIRQYIQKKYYKGEWPKLSDYITDISQYSPTEEDKIKAKKTTLPNGELYLDQMNDDSSPNCLEMAFHCDIQTRHILIYGVQRGTRQPWQPLVIYVIGENAGWYTYLPTRNFSVEELSKWMTYSANKPLPALTTAPRYSPAGTLFHANGAEILVKSPEDYDAMIVKYWNPLK